MEKNKAGKIIGAVVVFGGIVAVGTLLAGKQAAQSFMNTLKQAKEVSQDIIEENDKKQVIYEIKDSEEGSKLSKVEENI